MTEATYLDRIRVSYDTVAADYAARLRDELAGRPLERAMLSAFAELVRDGGGPVGDLGCGPGRVTEHLRQLGLDAFGVDLSPRMLEVARGTYPDLRFDLGRLDALDLADASLAGAVAWYSIIHTPAPELPAVLAEFHRVLVPGGQLLLAFQVGDETVHLTQGFGHSVAIDLHLRTPELMTTLLADAGLVVHARLLREPTPGTSERRQAFLLAAKPA